MGTTTSNISNFDHCPDIFAIEYQITLWFLVNKIRITILFTLVCYEE